MNLPAAIIRVLDIDLDIFVTPINNLHSSSRLIDDDYDVPSVEEVVRFLEKNCGLSRSSPTPGFVFDEHDKMFNLVKKAIETNVIHVPFELVHVDAHADMGAGQWAPYEYLLTELMFREPRERLDPTRGASGLNRGTVLLFLIACEWLSTLHYVYHPDDGNDFSELFLDYDVMSEQLFVQIPKCSKEIFQQYKPRVGYGSVAELRDHCEFGGLVPFELTRFTEFCDSGFDIVFLTRSPGFTPCKADELFDVIATYITPIEKLN